MIFVRPSRWLKGTAGPEGGWIAPILWIMLVLICFVLALWPANAADLSSDLAAIATARASYNETARLLNEWSSQNDPNTFSRDDQRRWRAAVKSFRETERLFREIGY